MAIVLYHCCISFISERDAYLFTHTCISFMTKPNTLYLRREQKISKACHEAVLVQESKTYKDIFLNLIPNTLYTDTLSRKYQKSATKLSTCQVIMFGEWPKASQIIVN